MASTKIWRYFLVVVAMGVLQVQAAEVKPSASVPDLRRAQQAFVGKDYRQAALILDELLKQYPDQLVVLFNRGLVEVQITNCAQAMDYFNRVKKSDTPLGYASRIYISRCWAESKNYEDAAQELLWGKGNPALEEEKFALSDTLVTAALEDSSSGRFEIAQRRLQLAQKLRRVADPDMAFLIKSWGARVSQRPDRGNFLFELGTGTNSNIYATAVSEDGSTPSPDRRLVSEGTGILSYDLARSPQMTIRPLFAMQWEENWGASLDRTLNALVSLELAKQLGPHWKPYIVPFFKDETIGLKQYLIRSGGSVGIEYGREKWTFGFSMDAARNFSQRSDFDYLTGSSYGASLNVAHQSQALRIEGWAGVHREWSHDLESGAALLPLRYRSVGVGGQVLWHLSSRLHARIQPIWTWKYFDTFSRPYGVRRIDLTISGLARVDYWLRPERWGVFLSALETVNQSSLGPRTVTDKNYDQLKLFAGVEIQLGI